MHCQLMRPRIDTARTLLPHPFPPAQPLVTTSRHWVIRPEVPGRGLGGRGHCRSGESFGKM
jgi:hypothetical protein